MGQYSTQNFPNVKIYGDNLDLNTIEEGLVFICDKKQCSYEGVKVEIIFAQDFHLTSSGYNIKHLQKGNPNGEYISIIEQTEIAAKDNIDRIIINMGKLSAEPFRKTVAVMVHEVNYHIDWRKAEQLYVERGVNLRLDSIQDDYFQKVREQLPKSNTKDMDYYLNLMYVVGMLECLKTKGSNYTDEEIKSLAQEIRNSYKDLEDNNMELAFDWGKVLELCELV